MSCNASLELDGLTTQDRSMKRPVSITTSQSWPPNRPAQNKTAKATSDGEFPHQYLELFSIRGIAHKNKHLSASDSCNSAIFTLLSLSLRKLHIHRAEYLSTLAARNCLCEALVER